MSKYTISLVCFFFFFFTSSVNASNSLDSLKTILEEQQLSEQNKEAISNSYLNIGQLYFDQKNYIEALQYFEEGLYFLLHASSNIPTLIALFHSKLGYTHAELNDFPKSIEHYKQAILIGEYDNEAKEVVIDAWREMGGLYVHIGDYEQAYNCHLKVIEMSEESIGLVYSYYVLGNIYLHQKRIEEALKYYHKSLDIASANNNKQWIYTCRDAIGVAYGKKGESEKWLKNSQLALEVAREANYEVGIIYGTHNLASYYSSIHCFEEALAYYNEVLQKIQLSKDKMGQVKVLRSLGKLYIQTESYNKAISHLSEALQIAEPIGVKPLIKEIYQLLYKSYHQASQVPLAYHYQEKYVFLSDSLTKANNTQRIWAMQIRHELQKKEATIEELQQTQKINQLYPKASLIGICVLLLMGFFLLNNNRLVQIKHQLLIQRNLQSEKERELLAQSNQSLEYFATIASNDLQVPLKRIDKLVKQVETTHQAQLFKEGKEYIHYISDGIKRMTNLLTDLLSYAKMDSRKTNWSLSHCNIPKLLEEIQRSLINVIEEKDAQIILENLPDKIVANQTTLTLLFQNLLSNGIKFVGDKFPIVHISCETTESEYIFSIQDNGIGILPENQKRIFEIFQRLHTNNEYKGTGIGLATCQKIVKRHKGRIWLTSEFGFGTTFYFSISRHLVPSRKPSVMMYH